MVSIAMAIVVLLIPEYTRVDPAVQLRAGVCYNALSKLAFRMTPLDGNDAEGFHRRLFGGTPRLNL